MELRLVLVSTIRQINCIYLTIDGAEAGAAVPHNINCIYLTIDGVEAGVGVPHKIYCIYLATIDGAEAGAGVPHKINCIYLIIDGAETGAGVPLLPLLHPPVCSDPQQAHFIQIIAILSLSNISIFVPIK